MKSKLVFLMVIAALLLFPVLVLAKADVGEFSSYGCSQNWKGGDVCHFTFTLFHNSGDLYWRYAASGTDVVGDELSLNDDGSVQWRENDEKWSQWTQANDDNFNIFVPWVPGSKVGVNVELKYKKTEFGSGCTKIPFAAVLPES